MQVVDITEIRRRNLDVLKAELHSLEAIGELIRKAAAPKQAGANFANVVSQYRGVKPMGNRFARKLEAAVGKPKGWMDTPHFEAPEDAPEAKEAGHLAMNMPAPDRQAWLKYGRLLVQQAGTDGPDDNHPPTAEPPRVVLVKNTPGHPGSDD